MVTPKATPKNGIAGGKQKVSFLEPMSNFSTINNRDYPMSDSVHQQSDDKNDQFKINRPYNGSSFGAIEEKGESNCPSY